MMAKTKITLSGARNIFAILIVVNLNILCVDYTNKKSDIIVYSYNRPLQLEAFLRSFYNNVNGINKTFVIYRTDKAFTDAYTKIIKRFDQCTFIKQSLNPKADFKQNTIKALANLSSDYIVLAVDDIIIKDKFDLSYCINILEKTKAFGFFFRLGKNTTKCYTTNRIMGLPKNMQLVEKDVYKWQFKHGLDDWNYPNNLDMTLYRKCDIINVLQKLNYNTPNRLEGEWNMKANSEQIGLCFELSKIVNIPLNLVQKDWVVRHMNYADINKLLELFNQGYTFDIEPLYKMKNVSPHVEYKPTFKKDLYYAK